MKNVIESEEIAAQAIQAVEVEVRKADVEKLKEFAEKLGLKLAPMGTTAVPEIALIISSEMTSANFTAQVWGTVDAGAVKELVMKGMRYEMERGGLSKAYLALAGLPGKKAGSLKLPEKFERVHVLYNEVNAGVFQSALGEALKGFGSFSVKVGQYVEGDKDGGQKQAQSMYEKFLAKEGKLEALALMNDWEGVEDWERADWVKAIHGEFFKK